MKTEWSERLKRWREHRGITQVQAADELAVSIHTLRAWEQGVRNPAPWRGLSHVTISGDNTTEEKCS